MSRSLFDQAVEALSELLCDLGEAVDPAALPELLRSLGWTWPDGAALSTAPLAAAVVELRAAMDEIDFDRELSDQPAELAALIRALVRAIEQFAAIGDQLHAPPGVDLTDVARSLGKRAFDTVLSRRLQRTRPLLFSLLRFIDVLRFVQRDLPDGGAAGYFETNWNQLPAFLRSPRSILENTVGWGGELEWSALLELLERLAHALGVPAGRRPLTMELAALVSAEVLAGSIPYLNVPLVELAGEDQGYVSAGIALAPLPQREDPAKIGGLALVPHASAGLDLHFELGDTCKLAVEGDFEKGIPVCIRPDGITVLLDSRTGVGTTRASIALTLDDSDLLFSLDGLRIERGPLAITAGFESNDLYVEAAARCRVALDTRSGDSMAARLLPAALDAGFDLTLGWSDRRGLYFNCGAKLEIDIPIEQSIGPVRLDSAFVGVALGADSLDLSVGLTAAAKLGPVNLAIERVGLTGRAKFGSGAGIAKLQVGFKPPTGIGVGLDEGVVKGGGFIHFDPEKGTYSGALSLNIQEKIAVTALGIITTKLPDGSKCFAFKILGRADFASSPIQIGMGFCIVGLGGLIAIDCTMNEDALREHVYAGTLDELFFPEDVESNAPAILAMLDAAFPAQTGSYVFGALARINWGSGLPIFRADLAILLEFGRHLRVALAGIATLVLPDPQAEIVRIQFQILGFIDFDRQTLSIDAALVNSHLAKFEIEGQAALRARWGDRPRLALSSGGFHPRYSPPADFPALGRMAIIIARGNPNISLSAYLAITENSYQFGCALHFYWRKKIDLLVTSVKIEVSGSAGFDVLIYFNPFHFSAELYACFELKVNGDSWMGVDLDLLLEGPNRFHVKGKAKFTVCKVGVSIDVDHYSGEKTSDPPRFEDPVGLLRREIQNTANWRIDNQSGYASGVALRDVEGTAVRAQKIDPLANELELVQTAVPLRDRERPRAVTRVGTALVHEAKTYDLRLAAIDGQPIAAENHPPIERPFAPGQFFDLEEQAKLDGAFEPHNAGTRATVGGLEHRFDLRRERELGYERHFKLGGRLMTKGSSTPPKVQVEAIAPALRRAAVRRYTHERRLITTTTGKDHS